MYLEKEVGWICFDWVGLRWLYLVHYLNTSHTLYFVSEVDSRNLLVIIMVYMNSAWVRILIPVMPLVLIYYLPKKIRHIFVAFSKYIHFIYQKHFIKNNTYLIFTGLQKGFDPIAADKTCVLFLRKKCVYVPYRIISILVGNEIASAMILICHMPLLPFLRKKMRIVHTYRIRHSSY